MDLADATLVALGEELGVSKVFTLLRRKPRLRAEAPACTKRFGEGRHFGAQARVFRSWMNARRVPFEAPKERSRVCFGGFRLPARSPAMRDEGRPDEACGGATPACRNALRRAGTGFSPCGSTLDHKDFSVYRWKLKRRFKLLPPAIP